MFKGKGHADVIFEVLPVQPGPDSDRADWVGFQSRIGGKSGDRITATGKNG